MDIPEYFPEGCNGHCAIIGILEKALVKIHYSQFYGVNGMIFHDLLRNDLPYGQGNVFLRDVGYFGNFKYG